MTPPSIERAVEILTAASAARAARSDDQAAQLIAAAIDVVLDRLAAVRAHTATAAGEPAVPMQEVDRQVARALDEHRNAPTAYRAGGEPAVHAPAAPGDPADLVGGPDHKPFRIYARGERRPFDLGGDEPVVFGSLRWSPIDATGNVTLTAEGLRDLCNYVYRDGWRFGNLHMPPRAEAELRVQESAPPGSPIDETRLREIAAGEYGPNRQEGKAMAAELLAVRTGLARLHRDCQRWLTESDDRPNLRAAENRVRLLAQGRATRPAPDESSPR